MTVTFRQKKQQSKTSYLYADIMFGSKRIKYSLGITVPSNTFDVKRQTLKGTENIEVNNLLSNYKSTIYKVMRELQLENKNAPLQLRNKLDKALRNVVEVKPITELVEFANMHLNRVCRVLKKRTILSYGTTVNKLISYQVKQGKVLTFEDVDYQFYHSFLDYCRTDLNLGTNTIGNHIKNIKALMSVATEEGLNTNLAFKGKAFKMLREAVDSPYLTLKELERLKQLDLTNSHLEKVRDMFVVACYTGLRIGDYHKINLNNMINNNTLLKVTTEKTGTEVIIPVHPYVYQTVLKYGESIPMISHQKFNKYVKEVVNMAMIGKVVTSHCARRSFATNAFKSGVPSLSIMQITGHTTEKNFLKYIKISREENASIISNNRFFRH